MNCNFEFTNPQSSSSPPAIHFHQAAGDPDLYEFDNLAIALDCDELLVSSQSFLSFFLFFGMVLFLFTFWYFATRFTKK